MDLSSIHHRCAFTDCYARNADELVISLRTGKDITAVTLIHGDPYAGGCMGMKPWSGEPAPMAKKWELRHNDIWAITVTPRYKREQYYFSLTAGEETLLLFEDGFYTQAEADRPGRMRQYFKFPWLNSADVITPPRWVNDTVWYQIMPDRFCRSGEITCRVPLRKWSSDRNLHFWDTFGGDLRGITAKLPYLHNLGVTGIYMTPIFLSNSNHKYNTFSYDTIDPDFGTEEDLVKLVDTAHSLGIRVMLDAVFNHCGTEFAPWQDVLKNGPESPYWDWFFVNQWPLPVLSKLNWNTEDGRFYTFAFGAMMPKLNTNNPEVAAYFLERCTHWVRDWHIDGIRFDVGNEVSHRFLKELNRGLKAIDPNIFLLGEIWHDSVQWLQGDEYDSVMNYPFMESIHNFWLDEDADSRDFMYAVNRVYSLYPEQVNRVIFNFLDTHDTLRALNRCGGADILYQQLAVLMTMPGTACIYYGTEIAMPGGHDPDCRRTMPWSEITQGRHDAAIGEMKKLIALRKEHPQVLGTAIRWHHHPAHPRLICYDREFDGKVLRVWLNAGTSLTALELTGKAVYARHLDGNVLAPGGICIEEV